MKFQTLIAGMTIEEKAAMLSGKNHWESRDFEKHDIPSIFMSDGPHGIRKQMGEADHLGINKSQPATCFPTAATLANSWDIDLCEEVGVALGLEASALDVHVLLGPGLNMKRSPLCGRNFEYFSEDPYHSGKLAAAMVKGIQSQNIAACPKHFAVNTQETRRIVSDSIVDERTLREIYLTAFEIVVKEANPLTLMTSYNEVNSIYTNENEHLLVNILRGEWGFDGSIITDWGGSNDNVAGAKAGSTIEMPAPGGDSIRSLVDAVKSGLLDEKIIDQRVDEILTLAENTVKLKKNKQVYNYVHKHHKLARKAAEQSIVLLKNNDNILPINSDTSIALIGDFAKVPRYQGAGSSLVNPTILEDTCSSINAYDLSIVGYEKGFQRNGGKDRGLIDRAVKLAQKSKVVLLYMGLDEVSESEGNDRQHMEIHKNQIELLEAISHVNENIIVVLSAGSAISMPWVKYAKGVVHGYLSGQASAQAVLNVITGKVNPSGKLNETYPLDYRDTPSVNRFPGSERTTEHREGIYIGYRYYNTASKTVRFPFGYGLSYTEFEYSNLKVNANQVEFTMTNIGNVAGAEIAQLYIGCQSNEIFRAKRELKGFKKVYLDAGESKTVIIKLDDKAFRYFNTKTDRWEVETADYKIMIGKNVEDIQLCNTHHVAGTDAPNPYVKEDMICYYQADIQNVSDSVYEKLLGKPIPPTGWGGKLGPNDALCQMYYAKSGFARFVYKILTYLKDRSIKRGKPDLNILYIYNMPFRGLGKMTFGMINMKMVEALLVAVNGKLLKGFGMFIKEFFKNKKANKLLENRLKSGNQNG